MLYNNNNNNNNNIAFFPNIVVCYTQLKKKEMQLQCSTHGIQMLRVNMYVTRLLVWAQKTIRICKNVYTLQCVQANLKPVMLENV